MNTPEQTTKNNHIDENKQEYINKLQTQLGQNDIRRVVQGRDYGRILRDYNTPAQWYKVSSTPRSIYFYDPHYQKYLQQQSKLSTNVRVCIKSFYIFYLFIFSYSSLFLHQFE
jgi:hypothetical protein